MSRFSQRDNTDLAIYSAIAILLVFGLIAFFVVPSHGQVADASSPRQFQFSFSAQDVNVIEAGLNELPRKMSEPVIERMQTQVRAMVAARAKADEDAKAQADKEKADADAKAKAALEAKVREELEKKTVDPSGNDAEPKK